MALITTVFLFCDVNRSAPKDKYLTKSCWEYGHESDSDIQVDSEESGGEAEGEKGREEGRDLGGTGVAKGRSLGVRGMSDEDEIEADTSLDSPPTNVLENGSRLKLSSTLIHCEVSSSWSKCVQGHNLLGV